MLQAPSVTAGSFWIISVRSGGRRSDSDKDWRLVSEQAFVSFKGTFVGD